MIRNIIAATLVTIGSAAIAEPEEVDFYCVSPIAAAEYAWAVHKGDYDTIDEMTEAAQCAFFSVQYGFVTQGEVTLLAPVGDTDLSVYRVVYPNKIEVYTLK